MGFYQYPTGIDTLVDFALDELAGGIAMVVVGLLLGVAIFGIEMISFSGLLLNIAVVALFIGGGIYVFRGMPLNNAVLILAGLVLVPLVALMGFASGLNPTTGKEEMLILRLLAVAAFVVVIAGAVDLIEEIL